MSQENILVVEDEEDVAELVRYNLEKAGFAVELASTGEAGLRKAQASVPDLLILDLMLPGIDGLEVCREIQKDSQLKSMPIVMLTAKGEESDIVKGLEMGADDYITKPFSPKVLIARVRRIIERVKRNVDDNAVLQMHEIRLDPARHEVRVKNKPVKLTFTEFNILQMLMRRAGLVFSRYQIVDAIHGSDYLVTDRAVDVQIVNLRRKLGSSGKNIETVRGVGYRFKD